MNIHTQFADVKRHDAADVAETAEEAIVTRRSVRGFLPDPVPLDLVRHILDVSARAPSGTNMQPWHGHVMTGAKLKELCDAVVEASLHDRASHEKEYKYYPDQFFEPYLTRRRTVGFGLYDLLGIRKGDTQRMVEQGARNFTFFDAPVGMMFTIDKRLEIGSWLDYGMYLENIMIVARQYGLHTCPQAAWPQYHRIVKPILGIPDDHTVVCGMALGYEDTSLVENSLRTDRAPLEDYMTFHTD
ncbi:nitroreductase [Minwuia thermotolerans]|uniref:Nitroreductase n=1 Tax=Minwuia thermotolerans TaxID=2056226 RepID=A0A2M9G5E3_9PROT|nr:nitroreductase [Minwuia thermotolerans]PJK30920.1 nitroreductase [Minwuia thermotolerans]